MRNQLTALALLLLLVGCSHGRKPMIFRDAGGAIVARGELALPKDVPAKGATFEGDWRLTESGKIFPPNSVDQKQYRGHVQNDGQIAIDLNPQMRDNNINLLGKWDRSGFYGKWYHSTLAGAAEKGTFRVSAPKPGSTK